MSFAMSDLQEGWWLSARGIPLCTGLPLDQRITCPNSRGRRPLRSCRLVAGDGGQPLGRKNASTGKTTITLDSYGSPLPPTRARAHSYARDLAAESGTICGIIGSAGGSSDYAESSVWSFPSK